MTPTLLLACYGLTFFLADSLLTGVVRNYLCKLSFFKELFSCYFCLGFWNSLFVSLLFADVAYPATNWVYFIGTHGMHGFAGATATLALNTVLEALERYNASRS